MIFTHLLLSQTIQLVSSKAYIFSPSLIDGICTLIVYSILLHWITLYWHNYNYEYDITLTHYMVTPFRVTEVTLFVFLYISHFVLTNVYLVCKFARWIIITLKSS